MNMTLYNIQQEHQELLRLLDEHDGELTPELEQRLNLSLENFQSKAISYGYVIKQLETSSDNIKAEIDRLKKLHDAAEKRYELFKSKLRDAMEQFEIKSVETDTLKISLMPSEAVVVDEQMLDMKWKKPPTGKWTPDKIKIKEALKRGNQVPGAKIEKRNNVQIK